uniref:Uncharacterized protein n=1 Tax=Anguilla anguilla TaxID=7936 RepID=A0A0E9XIL5_ANGAN
MEPWSGVHIVQYTTLNLSMVHYKRYVLIHGLPVLSGHLSYSLLWYMVCFAIICI